MMIADYDIQWLTEPDKKKKKIEKNDSLQQYKTSSRGKTHKKIFGETKLGPKQAKIGSKIRFFVFSSSLVH